MNAELKSYQASQVLGDYLLPEEMSQESMSQSRSGLVLIPQLLAPVSCGLFGISEDFIEKYQSLDVKLIRNREATFFLLAKGRSMEPTIFPNDLLIVDRSITQYHGRVCIVVYDGELICKRVFLRTNSMDLVSDNPQFKVLKVQDELRAVIWGVVVARVSELL